MTLPSGEANQLIHEFLKINTELLQNYAVVREKQTKYLKGYDGCLKVYKQ